MGLNLVCPECNGKLIETDNNCVCEDCGKVFDKEFIADLFVNKILKDNNIEKKPVKSENNANDEREQCNKYLELALNESKAGNSKSALRYAMKALEIDPKNTTAWSAKMKATAETDPFAINEIAVAGMNVIKYDESGSWEKIIFRYWLKHSCDLLDATSNTLRNTEYIQDVYKVFCISSVFTATKNTIDADKSSIKECISVYDKMVSLARAVPYEKIVEHQIADDVYAFALKIFDFKNAHKERLKTYGAEPTEEITALFNKQYKEFRENAVKAHKEYDPSFVEPIAPADPVKKSGCYVATAVYGSYDCPQVWTLRRYRDKTLAETWCGRAFIKTYYAISPTLVKWFGETKWFKSMWKKALDKMVTYLNENGFEDTPYNDN